MENTQKFKNFSHVKEKISALHIPQEKNKKRLANNGASNVN